MEKWASNINEICKAIMPYTYVLVIVAFLIIGGMFVVPSDESRQKAKKAIPWVVIGAMLMLGAVYTAKWLTDKITF